MTMTELEFCKLLDDNPDYLRTYLSDNLVDKIDAKDITEQSQSGFNQSVSLNRVVPFFEVTRNGRVYHRLFLKRDLVYYREAKRKSSMNLK